MKFKIFIVEDDPFYGQLLRHHLSMNPDYSVNLFDNAADCIKNLYQRPDVVCIDFGLPDIDGDELLKKIQAKDSSIPVIVISGQEDISTALNLIKSGAKDYIIKDDNTKDMLWKAIINIRENSSLKKEVAVLKKKLENKNDLEKNIIGKSPALKEMFRHIEKASLSNINISITGETGTGKEVVAKAIHANGNRSHKPFVAVNMAALPKDLIESELFGHEKGAFTGAVNQKKGKFEEADGGTIFLDEIAELDLNLQSKLLRVLQEREVVRIGGSKTIKFNIRLITATHKNLVDEVKKGKFREDLYYRVVGLPISLPPLRQRGHDILLLAEHFIKLYCKDNDSGVLKLAHDAKQKLMTYNFPGNVRELKAVIDLACVMSDGTTVTSEDITFHSVKEEEMFTTTEKTLREYNADIVAFFLSKYKNVMEVAKRLDVGKSTIYNMIKSGEVQAK